MPLTPHRPKPATSRESGDVMGGRCAAMGKGSTCGVETKEEVAAGCSGEAGEAGADETVGE